MQTARVHCVFSENFRHKIGLSFSFLRRTYPFSLGSFLFYHNSPIKKSHFREWQDFSRIFLIKFADFYFALFHMKQEGTTKLWSLLVLW